jgi:hypothetical protein
MSLWLNRDGYVVVRGVDGLLRECSTCPCAGCNNCSPQAQPEMQLVISGVTNSTCTGCSTLNGTFILRNAGPTFFAYCTWEYNPSGGTTCADFDYLYCQLGANGGVTANWEAAAGPTQMRWGTDFLFTTLPPSTASPFNCSTATNLSLAYVGTFSTTDCNGANSSCLISAL